MDERLKKIADEAREKFGLNHYKLERYEIYKERNHEGKAFYNFNMEWFPTVPTEPIEEDLNPEGTAVIEYHIQKQKFTSVIFQLGQTFSTLTPFPHQTTEEVIAWLEGETGRTVGEDVNLVEREANRFRFESYVDDIRMSPGYTVEIEFDDMGKLLSYHPYEAVPLHKEIKKSSFTMTLEEIEPLVKKQLKLIHYPSETENRFKPYYVMEEVFVAVDDLSVIPFLDHERTQENVRGVIEWTEPIVGELKREDMEFLCIATVEDAFSNIDVEEKLALTETQIAQSKIAVRDAFRTEYPDASGEWRLENLQYRENFIEAHCEKRETDAVPFKRKVVVFIHPENMSVLNFIDNGALFDIFTTFEPTEEVAVAHEVAFEKMLPTISLDPTYVYDRQKDQYVLCGLLDGSDAVDAVTGEVVSLYEL